MATAAGRWRAACREWPATAPAWRPSRRVVEAAPGAGIGMLTLFAFSSDNWRRRADEVDALMRCWRDYLERRRARPWTTASALEAIGRRDRLAAPLARPSSSAEAATAGGCRLRLRMAVDYSGARRHPGRRAQPRGFALPRGPGQRLSARPSTC